MQGSKRDTDVNNRLLDYVGEGEGGMIWENSIETCTLPYVKIDDQCKFHAWSRTLKATAQPRGIGWEGGGRVAQDRGDTCISMADSCWYRAKTITIL